MEVVADNGESSGQDRALSSIRVLVIDDQRSMRSIVRHLLAQVGIHDVVEAGGGEEALQILRTKGTKEGADPDVIICDLHMENMDGLEFCNAVRRDKNNATRNVPILILTADREKLLHDVAVQVGAMTVLTKPISANELLQRQCRRNIACANGVLILASLDEKPIAIFQDIT